MKQDAMQSPISFDRSAKINNHNEELTGFIAHMLDIECLGICYYYNFKRMADPYIWGKDPVNQKVLLSSLEDFLHHLILDPSSTPEQIIDSIHEYDPHIKEQLYVHLITFKNVPIGVVAMGRSAKAAPLCDEDVAICRRLLDLNAKEIIHNIEKTAYEKLFYTVINGISDYIYVTDPQTDEILFMNEPMKKIYHIDDPVGKTCWKLLQRGKDKRCEFCPIEHLKQYPNQTITWEEKSTINQQYYENKDSLIHWLDGRLAHLQQSTDITDFKKISQAANIDELTKLTNRRAGKIELQILLNRAKVNQTSLCLVLMDINGLKQTNDYYGHKEGDNKIRYITEAIQSFIDKDTLFFRLSGDEFVLAFYDQEPLQVRTALQGAIDKLRHLKKILGIPYELGFCYGTITVKPDNLLNLETLLTLADEKMYEQKRLVHLQQNEAKLQTDHVHTVKIEDFDYDKDRLYDALVESTDDYVYICNMKTGLFRYSPKMVKEFDLPGEVLKNAAAIWGSKVHPLDKELFLKSNQEIIDGRVSEHCVEYRAINRHHEWVWLRCRGKVIFDALGDPDLFAGIISNIGRKEKIDPLTGLYNKFALEEDIKQYIQSSSDPLALLLLNLDNFKSVNQLRDHAFGDDVLKKAAQTICDLVPKEATVYKLDADEFAVLLKSYSTLQIEALYKQIKAPFSRQQLHMNERYFCSISAGCAIYPEHANVYINLFKYASYALETSKKNGKDQLSFFSDQIVFDHLRKLTLTQELRESVENNFEGFSLQFQPIVYTDSKKIRGAEALLRWSSPAYGIISPSEFVPLLEDTRMIIQAGRWVFEEAVAKAKAFIKADPDFMISINLSYVQVSPDPIIPFIKETLEKEQLDPRNIIVEFTESYLASDNISNIYQALRDLGITIAMDDFGTGYASLNVLKQCPADIIKIDQAFVEKITYSRFDVTLVRMIIELCHEVNIAVCVEGVESIQEYEIIKAFSADYIQGFLFGRPCDDIELIQLIKQNRAS
ncbi:bifunctional diguanylate cyclase/phosphodiesterase [Beduini massiliensis]|uniref:bifunctional diguanylate cyclase/phosphodiesterase n=1 Tax=Beduini massiliensis TaxID=1585974 RepID=UPI0006932E93|nr:EAL domain-containing protein [Beduini massiliensis]